MNDLSNRNNTHSDLPLFSSDVFGGALPPGLPDQEAAGDPPSSISDRQPIIERVFAEAEPEFIRMYRAHLLAFAERVDDFIAGEVTHEFEERHGKLSKIEGKQLGGLYQSLQRDGAIEKTGGYRARNQGNPSAVYRLRK